MIQIIDTEEAPFVRSLSVIKRPRPPNGYARLNPCLTPRNGS
jgi:hypothetical protein